MIIAAALIAAAVTAILTPLAAALARRLHLLDRPAGYKSHAHPTPLLGGTAVAAGVLAGSSAGLLANGEPPPATLGALALGAGLILLAGLFDDARVLRPAAKLLWQVSATVAAGAWVAAVGGRLDLFLPVSALASIALTVLWILTVTNAMNFLDNMNGLCAGAGAVAAAWLAAISWRAGEAPVALVAAALGGACIGFLPHNYPRPRIFLGDAGSMFVGFMLAVLAVMGVYARAAPAPALAVLAPVCVLALPLLDLLLVAALRLRVGQPPWQGDRRHISHRLVRRGLRPEPAVALLWAVAAAGGFVGFLLPVSGAGTALLLLFLLGTALGVFAVVAGGDGLP